MSTTIDQKVVEMRFDNKNFEENVAESISTLKNLKNELKFEKATDGLEEVSKAVGKMDFSPLNDGIDKVAVKFNMLEVAAVTALTNIVNKGVDVLLDSINSLTFDQITEGWGKFEDKTTSVQTIMAATGKSIEEVSEQLDRLNWFSDETSFSFTDMTSNVGKFTSVGVELEEAVSAMEGIAGWASLAGKSSSEASRAMYNLSQAMGIGYLGTLDWKTIESLNMNTQEFGKVALDMAASMGTLYKYADGTYQTLKGTDVTIENMRETLKDKWFTKDVMMAVFEAYGGFANELSKATQDLDIETFKLLDALDEFDGTQESLSKLMGETGKSAKELMPILQKLASDEYELGRRAFFAGQEAKTLTDAIEATTDAVSTKWMNVFEILFGNYEQAKEFFTDLTEILYNVFADPVDQLKEYLAEWNEWLQVMDDGSKRIMGDVFRTAILDFLWGVNNILNTIGTTIKKIVPPISTEDLAKLTIKFGIAAKNFREFTESFAVSESVTKRLQSVWKGFTSVIGIAKDLFDLIKPAFVEVGKLGLYLADKLLTVAAHFGDWITRIREFLTENQVFQNALAKLGEIFSPVAVKAKELFDVFREKIDLTQFGTLHGLLEKVRTKLDPVWIGLKNIFGAAATGMSKGLEKVLTLMIEGFTKISDTVPVVTQRIKDFFKVAKEKIDISGFSAIGETFEKLFTNVKDFFSNLDIKGFFNKIWAYLSETAGKIKNYIANIDFSDLAAKILNSLSVVKTKISEFFKGFGENASSMLENSGEVFKNGSSDLFKNLVKGLLIFNGLKAFSGGDEKQSLLERILSPITSLIEGLKEKLNAFIDDTDDNKLRDIAVALGILAASLLVLASIDSERLDDALFTLAALMAAISVEMKWMSGIDASKAKNLKSVGLAMVEMAGSLLILGLAMKTFASAATAFSKLEPDDIWKTVGALTAMIVALAAMGAVNKYLGASGATIIAFAAALEILGIAMLTFTAAAAALSLIPWESLEKLGAIAGGMLVFVTVLAVVDKILGPVSLTMIAAALAMDLFAIAILGFVAAAALLTAIPVESLNKLCIVLLEMVGAFIAITSAATLGAIGLAAIAAVVLSVGIAVALAGAGVTLFALGINLLADAVLKLAEAFAVLNLGALLMSLNGFLASAAFDTFIEGIEKSFQLIPSFITNVVVGLIEGAKTLLTSMTSLIPDLTDTFLKIILETLQSMLDYLPDILVVLSELIIKLCEGLVDYAPDLVDSIVKLVVAVIDALTEHIPEMLTSALKFIDTLLGDLLETVRKVFTEGESSESGLPKLGKELSDFWNNIKPFIDGVKELNADDLAAIADFATAVLALTAAEVLDGMTSWFGKKKDAAEFGDSLVDFAPKLKQFGEIMEGVDTQAIKDGASAIADIARAFSSDVFKTGGVVQWFKGEVTDLEQLGANLVAIAPDFRKFEELMKGTDPDDVANSARTVTTIADAFNANTFKTKGIAQFILGEMTDLEDLGDNLVAIAPKFREFENLMLGTDPESVAIAAQSITTIADMFNDETFKTGGAVQWLKGEMSFEPMVNGLISFGTAIVDFSTSIASVNTEQMTSIIDVVKDILNFTEGTGEIKASIDKSFGDSMKKIAETGINDFVTVVANSGEKLQTSAKTLVDKFIKAIEGKKSDAEKGFNTILTALINAAKEKEESFKNTGVTLMTSFNLGIKAETDNIKTAAETIAESAAQSIEDKQMKFFTAGMNVMEGFIRGMQSKNEEVTNKSGETAEMALEAMAKVLDENSPSKAAYKIGAYVSEGFVDGLASGINVVSDNSERFGEMTLNALSEAVTDFLQNEGDLEPVIRPVLDLSDVEAGSRRLNTLISSDKAIRAAYNGTPRNSLVSQTTDNSRTFGGFTFNIYPQGGDAEQIADEIGAELSRRMRVFNII